MTERGTIPPAGEEVTVEGTLRHIERLLVETGEIYRGMDMALDSMKTALKDRARLLEGLRTILRTYEVSP